MNYIPNSLEARDIASLVHMQTNLRKHELEGFRTGFLAEISERRDVAADDRLQ